MRLFVEVMVQRRKGRGLYLAFGDVIVGTREQLCPRLLEGGKYDK